MPMQRPRSPRGHSHASQQRAWTLLGIALLLVLQAFPFVAAQPSPPSSISSGAPTLTGSAQPQQPTPTSSPRPPQPQPLPPGTRELRDGVLLADIVSLGQGQTYHFSLDAQLPRLRLRRQLERIIYSPSPPQRDTLDQNSDQLMKRQADLTPSDTTATTTTALLYPSSSPPAVAIPTPTPGRVTTTATPGPDGKYAVFISVSTCVTPKSSDPAAICPPLILYVSTSEGNTTPGPGKDSVAITSEEGLIQYTAHVQKDLFFNVYSPAMQGSWTGSWSIEVSASSQGYSQRYDSAPGLVLDDTDNTNASFLTHNFTMGSVPTFKVYVVPASQYPLELSRSLCAIDALQSNPLTKAQMAVTETSRTTYRDTPSTYGVLPGDPNPAVFGQRRQVRINSLQPGTNYLALFMTDVLEQAGAEVLYGITPFRTKRHDNCLLLTDLSFCHEVAYSVPVTPQSSLPGGGGGAPPGNVSHQAEIGRMYDDFARNLMDNFDKVLGQYDCSQSSYSLIRNCTDCTRAYRRWLCSVSIPRCTDLEDVTDPRNIGYPEFATVTDDDLKNPYLKLKNPGPAVVPRNSSTSRGAIPQLQQAQNPLFNPGDYAEVLPCIDLCFDVVQSCPSFLGFGCPSRNMAGSYAPMRAGGLECNGLGLVSIPAQSSAIQRWRPTWWTSVIFGTMISVLWTMVLGL
ncbi:stretch-activated cation channel mid1 [Actinomortierella wolfii]|nr:stretch-activated cation channel mid1 [Actinomortierella wolfii]